MKTVLIATALSTLSSLAVNFYFVRHYPNESNKNQVLRAAGYELIDRNGNVRAELSMDGTVNQPQFILRNTAGRNAVALTIEQHNQGFLMFEDVQHEDGRRGAVTLGYITGSDTDAPEDELGAWGLVVKAGPRHEIGFGMSKTGCVFGTPCPSPTKKMYPSKSQTNRAK